jgi:hypothetical protein
MMIPSASTIFSLPTITSVTSPLAIPCQRPQQPTKEQFNFSKQQAAVDKVQLIKSSKFGDFEDFKSSEMTVNKKGNLTRHKSSLALYSYEVNKVLVLLLILILMFLSLSLFPLLFSSLFLLPL